MEGGYGSNSSSLVIPNARVLHSHPAPLRDFPRIDFGSKGSSLVILEWLFSPLILLLRAAVPLKDKGLRLLYILSIASTNTFVLSSVFLSAERFFYKETKGTL
jgi:hypothetical protein